MNETFDWRNDPYWLSFAEHMAAALRLVWEYEQKLAAQECAKGQYDMKWGLLWYDDSANDITVKIMRAAARYQEKFGVMPDTCFVNPKDVPPAASVQGIHIKSKNTIMPNHVWLGVSALAPTAAESAAFEQARTAARNSNSPRVALVRKERNHEPSH